MHLATSCQAKRDAFVPPVAPWLRHQCSLQRTRQQRTDNFLDDSLDITAIEAERFQIRTKKEGMARHYLSSSIFSWRATGFLTGSCPESRRFVQGIDTTYKTRTLNQSILMNGALHFKLASGAARAPKPDTEPETSGGDAQTAQATVRQGVLPTS